MSTTVKIFIILNLVLALLFAWMEMTLYATHENWKLRWNDDTMKQAAQIKTQADEIASSTYENVKAHAQIATMASQISDDQAKIKDEANSISKDQSKIRLRDANINKANDTINALQGQVKSLGDTLELTRTRNSELNQIAQAARAVAFELNVKMAELEADYNDATTQLSQRQADLDRMTKNMAKAKAMLAIIQKNNPEVWKVAQGSVGTEAFVQGLVQAVKTNPSGQQDLVMLSVGANDKVEPGMEFIVFRGNQYIVKVRADRVLKDMVGCRVIPETWNTSGAQIQVGDMAQNRL